MNLFGRISAVLSQTPNSHWLGGRSGGPGEGPRAMRDAGSTRARARCRYGTGEAVEVLAVCFVFDLSHGGPNLGAHVRRRLSWPGSIVRDERYGTRTLEFKLSSNSRREFEFKITDSRRRLSWPWSIVPRRCFPAPPRPFLSRDYNKTSPCPRAPRPARPARPNFPSGHSGQDPSRRPAESVPTASRRARRLQPRRRFDRVAMSRATAPRLSATRPTLPGHQATWPDRLSSGQVGRSACGAVLVPVRERPGPSCALCWRIDPGPARAVPPPCRPPSGAPVRSPRRLPPAPALRHSAP